MIGPNVDQDVPNNTPAGLPYVREPVKALWWGKIFPFSWIGSWWSGKVSPQSAAAVTPVVTEIKKEVPETQNEEPESREERADSAALKASADKPVQAPKQAQTAGYIELFHNIINILSFGRWGSSNDNHKEQSANNSLNLAQTNDPDAQSKGNDSQVLSSQQIQQLPLTTPDGEVQGLTYTQPNALEEKTGGLRNDSADDVVKLEENKDALHQLLPEERKVEEGEDTGPVSAPDVICLPFGEFTGGEAAIGKGDANTVAVGLGSSNDNKASSLNSDIASIHAPQVLSPKQIQELSYYQQNKLLKQAIDDDNAETVAILWSDEEFATQADNPRFNVEYSWYRAGWTPFAYALEANKPQVAEYFSTQRCQITPAEHWLSRRWGGTYPIHKILQNELGSDCRKVIIQNIISDQQNAAKCIGYAVRYDIAMLEYFLEEQKIDPNICDSNGNTAFQIALLSNNANSISALGKCPGLNVNAKNKNGDTAFQIALPRCTSDIICAIVKWPGFDPNAQDENGNTACHLAVQRGDHDVTRAIFELPRFDPTIQNKNGEQHFI